MIVMRAKITYDPYPGRYSRIFREVSLKTQRAGAMFWHEAFLPRHFQAGADTRYGYAPRTPKHEAAKKREGYSPQALVMTGLAESRAKGGRPDIRAYPSRTTISLQAPSYMGYRRWAKSPDMAAEVFQILPAEQRRMEKEEQRYAEKQLRRTGRPHTVKIG